MREFMVGEQVWAARAGQEQVTVRCPVCFGKLCVTLILGDGSTCVLACDYCGKGYEGPQGTVREYEFVAKAENVTITSKERKETSDGVTFKYYALNSYFGDNTDLLFDTEEEALRRAEELCAEAQMADLKRKEHATGYAKSNLSWQVGYHKRMVENAEKEAAYHRAKVKFIQSRMKGETDG